MGPKLLKPDLSTLESVEITTEGCGCGNDSCAIRIKGPNGMTYVYRITGTLNSSFEVGTDGPKSAEPSSN